MVVSTLLYLLFRKLYINATNSLSSISSPAFFKFVFPKNLCTIFLSFFHSIFAYISCISLKSFALKFSFCIFSINSIIFFLSVFVRFGYFANISASVNFLVSPLPFISTYIFTISFGPIGRFWLFLASINCCSCFFSSALLFNTLIPFIDIYVIIHIPTKNTKTAITIFAIILLFALPIVVYISPRIPVIYLVSFFFSFCKCIFSCLIHYIWIDIC